MDRDELIARLRHNIDAQGVLMRQLPTGSVEREAARNARTVMADAIAVLGSRPAPTEEREIVAYLSRHPGYPDEINELPCSPADIEAGWIDYPLVILATDTTPSRDEGSVDRLRAAIERALIQISGGLCYHTTEAKHAQLTDADRTLREALKISTPEAQTVEGGGQA